MSEPNFIVVRAHPDLPAGFLPPDVEGRWFDAGYAPSLPQGRTSVDAVLVPTGRLEFREDGACAEVYEARP